MRDISAKVSTLRTAVARAVLRVSPSTIDMIKDGKMPKGDPLSAAKVAAIQAAKNTSQIIPYCHPMPVEYVGVDFELNEDSIQIITTVKAVYKTGVEMEALTAASVAALTIYDMSKMLDDVMQIENIRLESKKGGKSDHRRSDDNHMPLKASVLVMSDSIAKGTAEDVSGLLIKKRLQSEGLNVIEYKILPDDRDAIITALNHYADELGIDLVVTTGGTGISPTDHTPEAVKSVLDKELPGVTELIRAYGQERNSFSMLSRSIAGVRNKTVIVSLPGSVGGVEDSMNAIFPAIKHAFKMIAGGDHGNRSKQKAPTVQTK